MSSLDQRRPPRLGFLLADREGHDRQNVGFHPRRRHLLEEGDIAVAVQRRIDDVWFRRLDLRDHAREVGAAHRLIFFARQGQLVVLDMLLEEIGRAPSELQSLMRISYAVFCLKKKNTLQQYNNL